MLAKYLKNPQILVKLPESNCWIYFYNSLTFGVDLIQDGYLSRVTLKPTKMANISQYSY